MDRSMNFFDDEAGTAAAAARTVARSARRRGRRHPAAMQGRQASSVRDSIVLFPTDAH
jgi:hypothetical protein